MLAVKPKKNHSRILELIPILQGVFGLARIRPIFKCADHTPASIQSTASSLITQALTIASKGTGVDTCKAFNKVRLLHLVATAVLIRDVCTGGICGLLSFYLL